MLVNFHANQLHSEEFICNLIFFFQSAQLEGITWFMVSAGSS